MFCSQRNLETKAIREKYSTETLDVVIGEEKLSHMYVVAFLAYQTWYFSMIRKKIGVDICSPSNPQ